MPTLDDIRRAGEADLQEMLSKSDEQTRKELRTALRRYGSVQAIPESVWNAIEERRSGEIIVALYLLMINADAWTTDEIEGQGGRRVRLSRERQTGYMADASRQAARMALQTTDSLRNRLDRTVTDRQLTVDRSPIGELDLGDIDQALEDALNDKTRETTAANETTGAISKGQMGAGRRHEPGAGEGVQIDLLWQTEGDNKVCPRCSPLNGTTEETWGKVFPDGPGEQAHPNCRCSLRPVVRAIENRNAA